MLLLVAVVVTVAPSFAATDKAQQKYPGHAAVASAHPLATQAGLDVLQQGGNAFDAAIAVTAALAVVEPYSSGIGGGGFYLLHEAASDRYQMIDARETAPLAADKDMYLDKNGKVIPGASVTGALSAGIPGIPAALELLAEKYGRLTLARSLAPAIKYARQGFPVDSHYQRMAGFRLQALQQNKAANDIFLQDGKVPELEYKVVQNDLANTLSTIATHGAEGFYRGELAKAMINDVRHHGGLWSLDDLASYQIKIREPELIQYGEMNLVAASLPSSGGLVLAQILGMLEHLDMHMKGPENQNDEDNHAQDIHFIAEAMRRAYRDRAEFMGDPDYFAVPDEQLRSDTYIQALAESIDQEKATKSSSLKGVAMPSGNGSDTTHFSIIDKQGNKVSATLSVNYPFGSCFVAAGTGVLLNDEMDDFSAKPGVPNVYGLVGSQANAIEPGKRMLSSMTPIIAETHDRIAILGTPGGSRIITMNLLAILGFYEDKTASEIVNAGRFHNQYLPDEISYEADTFDDSTLSELSKMGHKLREMDSKYGNMQLIIVDKKTGAIDTASDKRGIGSARVIH